MNDIRLQQLKQFMKDDPSDPFNIYAIATEYRSIYLEKALFYYELLLNNHPKYLPTYYQVAQVYIDLGQLSKVENIYKKGIKLAREQNDVNAQRELQNAYNEFLFE